MHDFSFDKTGAITYDDGPLKLSDKAYDHMISHDIHYIWEMDGLLFRIDMEGCIGLKEERRLPEQFYIDSAEKTGSIFKFRIERIPVGVPSLVDGSYSSIGEALERVLEIKGGHSGGSEESSFLDAVAVYYLSKTRPIWTMRHVREEAATLIARAHLDEGLLSRYRDEVRKGFYAYADRGGKLYGAVSEILVLEDHVWLAVSVGETLHIFLRGDESDMEYASRLLALERAEKTPLMIKDSKEEAARKGFSLRKGINRRSISLTKRYRYSRLNGGENVFRSLEKEGKVKTIVSVSGYIREQPYGEGRKLRKTIWVEGFTRGQWVREGLSELTISK